MSCVANHQPPFGGYGHINTPCSTIRGDGITRAARRLKRTVVPLRLALLRQGPRARYRRGAAHAGCCVQTPRAPQT
jgi:hypothetical protein